MSKTLQGHRTKLNKTKKKQNTTEVSTVSSRWQTTVILMGGLLHLVQQGGDWVGPRPLLTEPNVTAHRSTASVPITLLLYDGALLCGFNVPIKG